jgi:hypothetical protein
MDIIGSVWAHIDQLKITEELTADSGVHFPGLVDVHASATQLVRGHMEGIYII